MDILEAIITRRSIRKYLGVPVEWDKVGTLLEAAKWAPSSGNLQNWKFIIVEEKEARHNIAEACLQQWWMETAPLHIVAVVDLKKAEQFYGMRGERLYSIQSCAAAIQNILLAATSLGLSSCWVGAFDEEKLKLLLSLPPEVRPQAVITIGYPDEAVQAPQRYTLEDISYFRAYGGQEHKIKDIDATMGYTSGTVQKLIQAGKEYVEKFGKSAREHIKKHVEKKQKK